jgi:hypothetical protein
MSAARFCVPRRHSHEVKMYGNTNHTANVSLRQPLSVIIEVAIPTPSYTPYRISLSPD